MAACRDSYSLAMQDWRLNALVFMAQVYTQEGLLYDENVRSDHVPAGRNLRLFGR